MNPKTKSKSYLPLPKSYPLLLVISSQLSLLRGCHTSPSTTTHLNCVQISLSPPSSSNSTLQLSHSRWMLLVCQPQSTVTTLSLRAQNRLLLHLRYYCCFVSAVVAPSLLNLDYCSCCSLLRLCYHLYSLVLVFNFSI